MSHPAPHSGQDMNDWRKIFEQQGTSRAVSGNAPLLLNEGDSVWMVAEGRVDVFSVPLEEGRPAGIRNHQHRAESGQILVGYLSDSPGGVVLMATAGPGTIVWQLSRQRLRELSSEPDCAEPLARLIDEWVGGLTAGVIRMRAPQRLTLLKAGSSTRLDAGGAAGPDRGTLWVRNPGPTIAFLGRPELAMATGDGGFPVASPGWLESREVTVLHSAGTEEQLKEPTFWDGFDRFHAFILRAAAQNADEATGAERSRLLRKSENDGRLEHVTLSSLAAVAREEADSPEVQGEDPLLAACRLVGEKLGISLQAPLSGTSAERLTDPIGAISRASHVRVRRVLLAGRWWEQDNGPLVGFDRDDRPLALLPVSSTQYEVVDPSTGTRAPLTAANAGRLKAFGHCFYPSFGPRRLSLSNVVRFSIAGTIRDWISVALMGLAGGVLGLAIPLATGLVFDSLIPGSERGQLLLLVLALAVAAAAGALFQFVQGIAFLRLETRMDSTLEAGVWDRLLNLPAPFFRQYAAGDLAYRVLGIGTIRQALTEAAVSSVLSLVFSAASFGLLFYYDSRLAWVACGVFAITIATTLIAALLQLRYERKTYELRGKIGGLVLQLVTGISRLRVAAAETRALAVWAGLFSRQRKLAFRARSVANWLISFNAALTVLASLALFSAVSLLEQPVSLGTFLAFSAAFSQILYAALGVSRSITSTLYVVPLYEQVQPVLEAVPEGSKAGGEPGTLSGEIEVSHVSFRYRPDGPLILDDVSVHFRPGEFVAFVGPSGAGKSSLLRLLLGFETPTAGSIYFDREDLAGLHVQAVRRQLGVVLQNGRLMPGDLLTNIIGSSMLTLEDAWEAARMSGLDKDIERMPMGMHTIISEGESTLSGGQRQRLMIARAIASKPRILFFDEATSALDNATQAQVSRSLEQLKATRVVIAHRLSTIQNADGIYVMDRGKIVQQGTYAALMREPGLFADLARRQMT